MLIGDKSSCDLGTSSTNNEKSISPFDEDISIEWGDLEYILSEKDKNSDSLKEMERTNRLPSYKDNAKYIESLKV